MVDLTKRDKQKVAIALPVIIIAFILSYYTTANKDLLSVSTIEDIQYDKYVHSEESHTFLDSTENVLLTLNNSEDEVIFSAFNSHLPWKTVAKRQVIYERKNIFNQIKGVDTSYYYFIVDMPIEILTSN